MAKWRIIKSIKSIPQNGERFWLAYTDNERRNVYVNMAWIAFDDTRGEEIWVESCGTFGWSESNVAIGDALAFQVISRPNPPQQLLEQ